MLTATQTPIVYFACVNNFRNGKKLKYLSKGRKRLTQILTNSRKDALYQPVVKTGEKHYFFFDYLKEYHQLDQVRILHFYGPAENDHLRIETGNSETNMHIYELSKFVALLPNLELVYLHGCATPRLLEMLIRRDIPAVMITESRGKDARDMELAQIFYTELAKGASLNKALMSMQQKFPRFGKFALSYNEHIDQIRWPYHMQAGSIPWGLYFLKENEGCLYQPFSERKGEGVSLPIYETHRFRRLVRRQKYRMPAAAMLGFLIAFGLYQLQGKLELFQDLILS